MKALALFCLIAFAGILLFGCGGQQIAKWKEAAEKGEAEAQWSLGYMYAIGDGVPKDYKEALKWWRKAAEQGDVLAQYNLGLMYTKGDGVPEDDKATVNWWRKAAVQGDASAQYGLGSAYNNGKGVIEDKLQAYAWWNIAAANGDEESKEYKTKATEQMTKEQIAEAQDLSREMAKANPKLMGD